MTPCGPEGRPRAGLRPYLVVGAGAGLLAVVPILLSDRAPGLLRRVSARIEDVMPGWLGTRLDGNLPEPDIAIHLAMFAVLGLLGVLASWSWRSLVAGQVVVAVAGLALEAAQGPLSAGRSVEVGDAVGNLVGQTVGVSVGLGVWALCRRRWGPPQ